MRLLYKPDHRVFVVVVVVVVGGGGGCGGSCVGGMGWVGGGGVGSYVLRLPGFFLSFCHTSSLTNLGGYCAAFHDSKAKWKYLPEPNYGLRDYWANFHDREAK